MVHGQETKTRKLQNWEKPNKSNLTAFWTENNKTDENEVLEIKKLQ